MAVYKRTAREWLSDAVSGKASVEAGLKTFPEALGRYAVDPANDR
jgi:hypothetical protein